MSRAKRFRLFLRGSHTNRRGGDAMLMRMHVSDGNVTSKSEVAKSASVQWRKRTASLGGGPADGHDVVTRNKSRRATAEYSVFESLRVASKRIYLRCQT